MPVTRYRAGCFYLVRNVNGPGCDFSVITGELRGCPAGDGCTRRDLGKISPHLADAQKSWADFERQKRKPKPTPKSEQLPVVASVEATRERDRRKKTLEKERTKAKCQGRQRKAIMDFLAATGMTHRELAELAGVSPGTLDKWAYECSLANWGKLAAAGIEKPEGL